MGRAIVHVHFYQYRKSSGLHSRATASTPPQENRGVIIQGEGDADWSGPTSVTPIAIGRKSGFALEGLPSRGKDADHSGDEEDDEEYDEESSEERVNKGAARKKSETRAERALRKREAKAERKAKRLIKKTLKGAYKGEELKQKRTLAKKGMPVVVKY